VNETLKKFNEAILIEAEAIKNADIAQEAYDKAREDLHKARGKLYDATAAKEAAQVEYIKELINES
jgi:hypothetical protein